MASTVRSFSWQIPQSKSQQSKYHATNVKFTFGLLLFKYWAFGYGFSEASMQLCLTRLYHSWKCHAGCEAVMTPMTTFYRNCFPLPVSTHLRMGSPGCAAHSPHHLGHPHLTDARMTWMDEAEDIKPSRSLLGLPELSWQGVYLPCCDRLAKEENPWVLRTTEAPAPAAPSSRTLEPCQAKHSQAEDLPSGMEGQVEDRCLEQVQTMVVGEVLKDVDTACKLLNIASGKTEYNWLMSCRYYRETIK